MIKYENYKRKSVLSSLFTNKSKPFLFILLLVISVSIMTVGCANNKQSEQQTVDLPSATSSTDNMAEKNVSDKREQDRLTDEVDMSASNELVAYDVVDTGREDPFMPPQEEAAFKKAKNAAIQQAKIHNANIAKAKRLRNVAIRELDDISPYSFNLPVPPTSLASEQSVAARIVRTKVVGIMYNSSSPTAIINVDKKDYLVRPGDKIIGEEYRVLQINPSWVTVGFGSNIYSASIGELFTPYELSKYQNDLYNLKNRFGGRRS